jgi:hypothetical protein
VGGQDIVPQSAQFLHHRAWEILVGIQSSHAPYASRSRARAASISSLLCS